MTHTDSNKRETGINLRHVCETVEKRVINEAPGTVADPPHSSTNVETKSVEATSFRNDRRYEGRGEF